MILHTTLRKEHPTLCRCKIYVNYLRISYISAMIVCDHENVYASARRSNRLGP